MHASAIRICIAMLALMIAMPCGAAEKAQPAASAAPEPTLTADQMREDLVYLRDVFGAKDKSYDARSRAEFEAIVNKAIAHADALTVPKFAFAIARAVAAAHNSHTAATPQFWFHAMPLRFWWFADGLYVVKAHPDFAYLVGARIEKLGTLTPEQAFTRLEPYLSGREEWQRVTSPNWLIFLETLHEIGASASDDEASLTFRLKDGSEKTVEMSVSPAPDPSQIYDLGAQLIPDDKSLPGRWPQALDGAPPPLAFQPPVDIAGQMIADGRVLYIRSNHIVATGAKPFDGQLAPIQQLLIEKRPKYVIIDLRFNTGGDFFNTLILSQALPFMIGKDGRVFVLVGGITHSAALITAARLKYFGGKRTLLIGTPMAEGEHGDFWAEGGKLTLPNSHIPVSYASEFEDWGKGCTDLDKCYWASVAFGVKNVSLKPDVLIAPTFADYAAGRDPLLEAALARLPKAP